LVNSRWLPPAWMATPLESPCVGLAGDEVAYVYLGDWRRESVRSDNLSAVLGECRDRLPQRGAGGVVVKYPWELVDRHAAQIIQDFEQGERPAPPPAQVVVVGPRELLALDPTAQLDPLVVFDTPNGPLTV